MTLGPPVPVTDIPIGPETVSGGWVNKGADDVFSSAELMGVVRYLLNGKHLKLPKHWHRAFDI